MLFVFKLAPSKREFMAVLLFVVVVNCIQFNNAYLHSKRQQIPVWEEPQAGGVFLKLYSGHKTLVAVSHDL